MESGHAASLMQPSPKNTPQELERFFWERRVERLERELQRCNGDHHGRDRGAIEADLTRALAKLRNATQ
jgi:hypothetical protein